MTDQRKFQMLTGASVLLVLLIIAYNSFLETSLASFLEAAGRRRHYEQTIMKKGLTLHEGEFWKKRE